MARILAGIRIADLRIEHRNSDPEGIVKVRQISDWALEDQLSLDGAPLVVLFMETGSRMAEVRRYEFRRVAHEHPEVAFFEVDLLENPSLGPRYSITATPVVLVFNRGVEVARHVGAQLETTVGRILGPCAGES
jgi:hypothetical protein